MLLEEPPLEVSLLESPEIIFGESAWGKVKIYDDIWYVTVCV